MQLYFIRHAQSENNRLWAETGSSEGRDPDPELTEVGHEQAQLLAEYLAYIDRDADPEGDFHNRHRFGLTHLYCSLMRRSIVTGRYIAELLDLPLRALESIHEHGGIWDYHPETKKPLGLPGPGRAFFEEKFPFLELPASMVDEGWWDSRPYEEWEETVERAHGFIQYLLDEHGNDGNRVAIVSHGGFGNALLQALFNYRNPVTWLDRERHLDFFANNTAISRFDFGDEQIRLIYLNHVDHLPTDLIT